MLKGFAQRRRGSRDRRGDGPDLNLAAKAPAIVILNLFQDNTRRRCVILKQVQDDEAGG